MKWLKRWLETRRELKLQAQLNAWNKLLQDDLVALETLLNSNGAPVEPHGTTKLESSRDTRAPGGQI